MLRIIEKPKKSTRVKKTALTDGQIRSLTKAASQIIAVTVAEKKIKVLALLRKFQAPLTKKPSSEELITRIMDKLAHKDRKFNQEFEQIIIEVFPELGGQESYDNFGETPFQFGSTASRGFGGSSGSSLIDGAKTIGGGAASGAASGGVAGGILGAIGGIFGFAASAKQQKAEKEKASAMTFASMLQYKAAKLTQGGAGAKNIAIMVTVVIGVIGLIAAIMIYSKNKKAKKWDDQVQVA